MKNNNPLEKEIEDKVCRYARSKGMLAYKFNSQSRAAVPDRLFLYRGHFFFIEFKRGGQKPTPAQKREHATLENNQAFVFVVDNIDTGKFIIDAMVMGVDLDKIII